MLEGIIEMIYEKLNEYNIYYSVKMCNIKLQNI